MNNKVLKDALIEKLTTSKRHLWETPDLAQGHMEHEGHYPVTEDAGYRRVLRALNDLENVGEVASYTTVMNGRVWWLKSRVN